jgi:hypothetical protein
MIQVVDLLPSKITVCFGGFFVVLFCFIFAALGAERFWS